MTDKKTLSAKLNASSGLKDSKISGSVNVERTDRSRRTALLGAIGVAGAASLPSEWKKPVIDALVLPSHAQMSPSVMTQSVVTTIQQSSEGIKSGIADCNKYGARTLSVTTASYTYYNPQRPTTYTRIAATKYQNYFYATNCTGTDANSRSSQISSRSVSQSYSSIFSETSGEWSTILTSPESYSFTTIAFFNSNGLSYTATTAITYNVTTTTAVTVTS